MVPAVTETAGGDTTPAPGRKRRGYWVPGLVAMAVLLAIGLALGAGDLVHSTPSALAGPDVAQQIAVGMQAQEGTHTPPIVHCPAAEPVRNGWRFVCTRSQGGRLVPVQVTEIDGRGHLRWHLGS
jgi:hypothetical protein